MRVDVQANDAWRRGVERRRRLLGVRDVAEYLGLSKDTVHEMCRKHRIPHLKIGGRIRFEPEEFYRWVETHRRGYQPHRV